MAKENFIEAEAEAENGPVQPLFKSYEWGHEEIDKVEIIGEPIRRFMTRVHHVGTGISAVLRLIEMSQTEEGFDRGRPIIGASHADSLLQLARVSADYLSEDAEKMNDWAYDYHTPEGIKEREGV